MILGVGIDHCQITRMAQVLERYNTRFMQRYFPGEVAYCTRNETRRVARIAMHFAAKEATAKALGTGFRHGVSLSTIEVIHLASGQPTIQLHDAALIQLATLTPQGMYAQIAVSLSDEADLASAICVIDTLEHTSQTHRRLSFLSDTD